MFNKPISLRNAPHFQWVAVSYSMFIFKQLMSMREPLSVRIKVISQIIYHGGMFIHVPQKLIDMMDEYLGS